MIDLDSVAPCGWCGGRVEWAHTDNSALYDGRCVSCGVVLPAYDAPWTWRDIPKLAADCGEGGHHLRALIAEVERLTRELSRRDAAVATAAMEEREAVTRFFRLRMEYMRRRGHNSEFHRGAYSALDASIHMLECGVHRREDA